MSFADAVGARDGSKVGHLFRMRMPGHARRGTLKLNRRLQNSCRVEKAWGDRPVVSQLAVGLVTLVSILLAAGLGASML